MDADQNDICQFLKSWPGQFVSRKEICRRAGGKWKYREDEHWAVPVLQRMVEDNVIESDDTGHFRLLKRGTQNMKNQQRLWMSPAVKKMLQKSSRKLVVVDLDKELEQLEGEAGTEKIGPSICYLIDEQPHF